MDSTLRLMSGMLGLTSSVAGRDCVVTQKADRGVIMFGPYEDRLPGRYRVEYDIGLADMSLPVGNPVCVTLDVVTNRGQTLLAERFLLHSHLNQGLATFSLEFFLHEPRTIEYRVHSNGQSALNVSDQVRVTRVTDHVEPTARSSGLQRVWENEREFMDGYLRNVSGLIHVGANLGQERRYYWLLGIDVIWVEPIREIYEGLVDRISSFPRQRAINALLTDKEGDEVVFRIASNNAASSSVLPFEDHAVIFPGIEYVEQRTIVSTTLAAMIARENISLDRYEALTLDVEGAEKLVLEGAGEMLKRFKYVKCEVADFPARTGTPTALELDAILTAAGFSELIRRQFVMGPGHEGTFWDIVWKKVSPDEPLHKPGVTLPLVMNSYEVELLEKCE